MITAPSSIDVNENLERSKNTQANSATPINRQSKKRKRDKESWAQSIRKAKRNPGET